MFRLFSREEKEPTSKLELINQLETMVFEINDKIKELSSPVHRDKLLFSLSKYSLDDPYNVEGIKDYLTDEIEKLNSIVTNRGQIALILPMLFVMSCLKSTSEENQELRNLLFTTSIPMEGLILYSYFSTKYEIYQLNNILELVNKNLVKIILRQINAPLPMLYKFILPMGPIPKKLQWNTPLATSVVVMKAFRF